MGALGTGGIYEAAPEQTGCCEGTAAASLDGALGSAASAAGFNPDNPHMYPYIHIHTPQRVLMGSGGEPLPQGALVGVGGGPGWPRQWDSAGVTSRSEIRRGSLTSWSNRARNIINFKKLLSSLKQNVRQYVQAAETAAPPVRFPCPQVLSPHGRFPVTPASSELSCARAAEGPLGRGYKDLNDRLQGFHKPQLCFFFPLKKKNKTALFPPAA